jgi:hypothetical protein
MPSFEVYHTWWITSKKERRENRERKISRSENQEEGVRIQVSGKASFPFPAG